MGATVGVSDGAGMAVGVSVAVPGSVAISVGVSVAVGVSDDDGGTIVAVGVEDGCGTPVLVAVGWEVGVRVAVGRWVGVLVAVGCAGKSDGLPGKVSAMISCMLVKPSPSESIPSMAFRAAAFRPLARYACPNGFKFGALV